MWSITAPLALSSWASCARHLTGGQQRGTAVRVACRNARGITVPRPGAPPRANYEAIVAAYNQSAARATT